MTGIFVKFLTSSLRFPGFLFASILTSVSVAQEHTPLQVSNQNPLVKIFALPVAESAKILEPTQESTHISVDWASNFTSEFNSNEFVFVDGESAQVNIRWRYGFDLWEFGLDLNFSRYSGGSLDNFIENWHSWFGLPNGGRELADRNQLRYEYIRDGMQQLDIMEKHSGFGDTRLTGAYQLNNTGRFDLAIRGGIKIPTGESNKLLGSEGTDINLGFMLGDEVTFQKQRASYFFGAGAIWTEDGEILPAYRENTVYYFHGGLIKSLAERWQLKLQLDGHTAFYDSALRPLSDALQLSIGGAYRLSNDLQLDFAIVEDVVTDSSSDVSFHLNLYNLF